MIQGRFKEAELVFKPTKLVTAVAGLTLNNIPPSGMVLKSGSQIFFPVPIILSKIWGLSWIK